MDATCHNPHVTFERANAMGQTKPAEALALPVVAPFACDFDLTFTLGEALFAVAICAVH